MEASRQERDPLRARGFLRSFLLPALPSLGALLIFAFGFWAGRYVALRPFREQIRASQYNDTLGHLVGKEEQSAYASAYQDPATATREMDRYAWAIRSVLTPFVGNGVWPGQTDNALINSRQFRSDRELQIPKRAGVYRIFLTGGSTAFGSGAPSQDKTIGGFLERVLNAQLSPASGLRYEVLTMANPGWASTHERIVIENRLSELAPDLVISFSGNNDVHWGHMGRDVLWFRSYPDEFFWQLINTARKSAGFEPMPDVIQIEGSSIPPMMVAERLEKNARLSAVALGQKDVPYVFVLQPTIAVATKTLSAREMQIRQSRAERMTYFAECYEKIRARLPGSFAAPNLFLDQADIFSALGVGEEIFIDSYHFGDRGNEIVANALATGLRPILDQKKP